MDALNKVLLIFHFAGLAMGFSVSISNIVISTLMPRTDPAHRPVLGRLLSRMSKVGALGVIMLWATGVPIVFTKYGGFSGFPPSFHFKLAAVVLLTLTVGYISVLDARASRGDEKAAKLLPSIGKVATLFAVLALVAAVLTFS